VKRELTDEEVARLEASWKHYVELKDIYLSSQLAAVSSQGGRG